MAESTVDIFNLALSAVGADLGITDPEENSREAAACRLWFPITRDNVLAAAPWESARRHARLARIAELDEENPWGSASPDPSFRFRYSVPADLLHPYYLQSFARFSYSQRRISCDEEAPILYYNARVPDISTWDPGLKMAIIYMLAVHLSVPLTGRSERLQANAQLAADFVMQAKIAAANNLQQDQEILPDWIAARGYSDKRPALFTYPWTPLNLETVR